DGSVTGVQTCALPIFDDGERAGTELDAALSFVPAHHDKGKGGVEFRPGALSVVNMVSDASFHTKGEMGKTCYTVDVNYSGATAKIGKASLRETRGVPA